ncbi:MAG: NapC/NirT family cytochrome c [Burkholderiaceae bacterium]
MSEQEFPSSKAKKSIKWIAAMALLVGLIAGVIGVGVTTTVVHWSGSTAFCSTGCHSMDWVAAAYQRSPHAKNASGVTAGCTDCHLKYESTPGISPFQYVGMLYHKATSGSVSAWGEVRGTLSTEQKWEAEREHLSKRVSDWMESTNFMTCRGCHDLEKMANPNNPMIAEIHAGLAKADKVNCLECHQGVGHVYLDKK